MIDPLQWNQEEARQAYEDRREFEEEFPWPPEADIADYEKFEANAPKPERLPFDPWDDYGEGKL